MKTNTRLIAISVPALLCLSACQSLQPEVHALKVMPAEQVRHGTSTPEALYAVGRYQQGQVRYDLAIGAYTRLLADYPDHVEARNALGIIFARQGHYDAAIQELERATANAPESATIRNNLGYVYMLRGNVTAAIAVLETAARLDPENRRVQENLAIARGRGGAEEVAQATHVASVTAQPEAEPAARADRMPERMQLVAVATNVFALQLAAPVGASGSAKLAVVTPEAAKPAPASIPAPAPVPTAIAPAEFRPAVPVVRLEVSNGNGVAGLARETSGQLQEIGYAKARLTNALSYRLPATEIQYRPGFELQARDLQASLREGIPLVASSQLRPDIQVRLLLGKDVKSANEVVAQGPSPAIQLAAVTAP